MSFKCDKHFHEHSTIPCPICLYTSKRPFVVKVEYEGTEQSTHIFKSKEAANAFISGWYSGMNEFGGDSSNFKFYINGKEEE